MSKHYNDICNKIMQSNNDLHTGPNIILKEIESIKKDMQKLSLKLDQIYKLLANLADRDNY